MIMVAVWIVGSIYSILVVALSSNNAFNVFNERTDLIQWSVSTEDYVLAIANLIILILAFILVTGSYTATILFLWRKSNGKILAGVHFTSIKRMALNIVAFAATCFVMTGFVGLPLFLSSHIVKLQQLNTVSSFYYLIDTQFVLNPHFYRNQNAKKLCMLLNSPIKSLYGLRSQWPDGW